MEVCVAECNVRAQAACYGRAFCAAEAFPRDRIVTVCRQLRILNALRAPRVGLPLTAAQAEALTLPVVVSRLINGRRHLLALRIATLLGMGPEKVRPCLASCASCVIECTTGDGEEPHLRQCRGDFNASKHTSAGKGAKRSPPPGLFCCIVVASHAGASVPKRTCKMYA